MWYTPKITTPPDALPVSLAEAKRHVHAEDFADDDGYLASLIQVATDHVQAYCGAYFSGQTVEIKCDCFGDLSHVPLAPITAVTSITYFHTDGASQTIASSVYELRDDAILLKYGQRWPPIQHGSRITLTAEVGPETCPPAVKHAMLLWIGDAYDVREPSEMADFSTMDALLCNHRHYFY